MHKAVAFDVLAEVAPSYAFRVTGMALGATILAIFWTYATAKLMKHAGMTLGDAKRELDKLTRGSKRHRHPSIAPRIGGRVFVRGIGKYLRRDFHPNNRDHSELIARALTRLTGEGILSPAAS